MYFTWICSFDCTEYKKYRYTLLNTCIYKSLMVYFIFHGRLFFLLKVQTHVKLSYYCINSASVKREKYVKCSP